MHQRRAQLALFNAFYNGCSRGEQIERVLDAEPKPRIATTDVGVDGDATENSHASCVAQ